MLGANPSRNSAPKPYSQLQLHASVTSPNPIHSVQMTYTSAGIFEEIMKIKIKTL